MQFVSQIMDNKTNLGLVRIVRGMHRRGSNTISDRKQYNLGPEYWDSAPGLQRGPRAAYAWSMRGLLVVHVWSTRGLRIGQQQQQLVAVLQHAGRAVSAETGAQRRVGRRPLTLSRRPLTLVDTERRQLLDGVQLPQRLTRSRRPET